LMSKSMFCKVCEPVTTKALHGELTRLPFAGRSKARRSAERPRDFELMRKSPPVMVRGLTTCGDLLRWLLLS